MLVEFLAAAALSGAPPQAVPVAVPTAPHWLERPNGNDIARVYPDPDRGQFAGVSGEAELDCRLAANGRLERCRVFAEAPVGAGFGMAALALAPKFRLEPPEQRGAAVVAPLIVIRR